MKHALMIIAHKNFEQLCHLVFALKHDALDIYVHIDKKWNIQEEKFEELKTVNDHVTICKRRISGYLDTWSLCEIALELMRLAKENDNYGYYYLLSGQDYPIKPIDSIVQYLDEQYPRPIIDCTPMRKDNWIYSGFKWIRFHAYYRLVERMTNNQKLRKFLLFPAYVIQYIITKLVGSPYKWLEKENCKLYGGSAWWCLPSEIVDLCLREQANNTKILRAFKIKNTPEETFFQTMAMRSKFKDMIEINDPYEILQNCMTYAYFFDNTHEATGHPFILTDSNYDMLLRRKELFARKFDKESYGLIQKIDREVLMIQ